MAISKTFWCANKDCLYEYYSGYHNLSKRSIDKCKQELDGNRLCEDCYDRGFRIKHGVVVYRSREGSS